MPGNREIFDNAMREGHAAAWDQQWEQAVADYSRAVEEFPEDPDALNSLGLALLQSLQIDEALAVYEQAARLDPADPIPLEKTAEILERLGRHDAASPRYMAVAEMHLARRDVEKAIDNWARAVRLDPDLLQAHQRLALAYERTNKRGPAVTAYLNVARLLQAQADYEAAAEAAEHARALEPRNSDVLRAVDLLQRGHPLPRIRRPGGATDALRAARAAAAAPDALAAEAHEPEEEPEDAGIDPADDARYKALAALAAFLFDLAGDEDRDNGKAGLREGSGLGQFFGRKPNRELVVTNLAEFIDAQNRQDASGAQEALEKAVGAGLDLPAAHMCLGYLYLRSAATGAATEGDAATHLRLAAADEAYRAGANYALAMLERAAGRRRQALQLILGVLRDVDLQTVPPGRRSDLNHLYEGLIEETMKVRQDQQVAAILNNVTNFLSGAGWYERVKAARRQMDLVAAEVDGPLSPLADILAMSGSDQVIEALRVIDDSLQRGLLESAMDEAYRVIDLAPTYLPLHLRIGEILVREDRLEAAITKYMAVAQVYEVRGDVGSAGKILERVIRLAPMDPSARNRLIHLYASEHRIDDALRQHVDLAETYYQQADLTRARQTFADGLRLASQSVDQKGWAVQFLHAMGDIDTQRLDWRQALRVYQQIKAQAPGDEKARTMLVDLHFRLGQIATAMSEVDDWLRYYLQQGQLAEAVEVLEELVRQRPDEAGLRTRLARFYQEQGRKSDAIAQLDALSELQIRAGQQKKAAETVRAILALQPASANSYRQLLGDLESGQR